MRKLVKIFVLLLSLTLALSFTGAAGAVFADAAPDGSCSVSWAILARDAEGQELRITDADEAENALGGGFALSGAMEASGSASVAALRESGIKITPPAGYRIDSVLIVAEGGAPDEGSTSLLPLAKAFVNGSGAVALDAAVFAEGFDASAVGSVFNGSGSAYVLEITLEKSEPSGAVTLSYQPGAMASVLGDAALFDGGNIVSLFLGEDGSPASGSFAALSEAVSDSALNDYGKQFMGWKLTLSGGATAVVQSGEDFALSSSATLEALWKDVLVFSFTGGEKLYDGTPLTGSYSRSGQLKEGDTLEAPEDAFTLSRTAAGESEATVDLSRVRVLRGEEDVTGEYDFLVRPATLRVIQRGVTFTVADAQKEYDGTPLAASSYSLSAGELVEGHSASVSYAGQQTVPGTSTASASVAISDAEGRDVSDNYNISVVNGSLTVLARSEKQPLTVTVESAEKEYDGTPDFPSVGYSLTEGSLLGGDRLSAGELSGSAAEVGTGSISGSFTVLNGDTDVSENYSINVVPGKLTIKPRALVLTADSAEKDYDGTALTKDSFTITSGTLVSGHTLTASVTGSQTKAGSSANKIDPASVKITAGETDLTAQYDVRLVDGTLTVNALPEPTALTVTMKNASREYDGTALSSKEYEITSGKLEDGDKLVLGEVTGSQTNVGVGSVTASFTVLRGKTDVTKDYAITVVPGKLTVTARPLTLTADSAKKDYDGKPLTKDSFTVTSGTLVSGHKITASVTGSQTEAGSSANKIDPASVKITAGGKDVTAQYRLRYVDGTLTVNAVSVEPAALTVTMKSAEKEYDGTPLTSRDFEITSGTLAEGDKLVLGEVTGSQTNVGVSTVTAAFTVQHGKNDVSANYSITVKPGRLTVKARALVLTADSAEKDYDGKPLTKDSFTVTSGTPVSGHKITAVVNGSQTEVGSSANKIDPASVKVKNGDKDVTAQYSIRLVDGTLTVRAPAASTAITVKMKSAEKEYDGKPLTSKDFEISSGTLAEGDKLVLGEVTGSQTDAGVSSVTASFTVMHGKTDVTAKYSITVTPGKLTVKPRAIIVTAASASKVYDGRPLTSNSFKISSGELVKGHQLTATVTGSQTEIGSSANVVVKSSIKITDGSGNDVAKNYDVTTAAGTLTVNRDPVTAITLTVGDASKVYDGKPYRFLSSDVKISSGLLPSGYRIEATFNPEAPTDAGKYDVTIKNVTIRDASGADVTSQFNITRARGTLTITQRPLLIETKAANKVYDGTPLTERSTPTITGRVEGHQVTLRITGSQTKVGSSENTVSDVKISDKESGADVTKNYAISYQYGMLTVTAASGGSDTQSGYTWVSGSSGTLFVKFDHSYDGFESVAVDGKELDRSSYTSASGSTEIWLKASYLNTLSPGTHTLKVSYSGGETVQTSFEVKSSQPTRTGDGNRLGLWIAILAAALAAVFAAAWYLFLGKDRRWKKRPAGKNR